MQTYYKSQRLEAIDNFVKNHSLENVGHKVVLKKVETWKWVKVVRSCQMI